MGKHIYFILINSRYWEQYEPCEKVKYLSPASNYTCFLPNSFLQGAVSLGFAVYVQNFFSKVYVLSQPSNRTLYYYRLWINDNYCQADVTSDYFSDSGGGVLLVVANTSPYDQTTLSVVASGYYFQTWQKWELWVPIGLLILCILGVVNSCTCLLCFRRKKKQELKIHTINEMLEEQSP
jgi:hypothetical protein